ncbi:MAG: hypothetical protein L0Y54_15840 [Sporichthyaceae bacterium]|nr:hypothetical protein [Sporichthyaceae bacterium]
MEYVVLGLPVVLFVGLFGLERIERWVEAGTHRVRLVLIQPPEPPPHAPDHLQRIDRTPRPERPATPLHVVPSKPRGQESDPDANRPAALAGQTLASTRRPRGELGLIPLPV